MGKGSALCSFLVLFAGLAAVSGGCGSDPSNGTAPVDAPTWSGCGTSGACPAGSACVAGQCVASSDGGGQPTDGGGGPGLSTDAASGDAAEASAPLCPGADRCFKEGATRACWDGPALARNVGACTDGTQTCQGGHWGACVGEVLPAAQENCSDATKDANCNGAPGDGCPCTVGATRSCFSGPAALAGTGVCVAGTQKCVTQGEFSTWGASCDGEVPPPCDYKTNPLDAVPTAHVETTAAVLNDRLFVISGAPGSESNGCGCFSQATTKVDVLDPTAPTGSQWGRAADVNIARGIYPVAVTVGCNIFLFGGTSTVDGTIVRTVERYDPGPDQWVKLPSTADLPTAFTGPGAVYAFAGGPVGFAITAAAIGTDVFVIDTVNGTVQVFDTTTSTWRAKTAAGAPLAPLPAAYVSVFNVAVGVTARAARKVIVAGATNILEYDVDANAWSHRATVPNGASLAEHAVVADGSRVVTLGGDYASTGDRIIVYDTDTYAAAMSPTHLSQGRSDHVAGVVNGKFYLAGGIVPGTATALVPAFEITGGP